MGATYDPRNALVYVVNEASSSVSVLNGSNVVASINITNSIGNPAIPDQLAYDTADGFVYVFCQGAVDVPVINGTAVIGNVSSIPTPSAGTYDPVDEDVYAVQTNNDSVTLINGTKRAGVIGVGDLPSSATYDPVNALVYVVNQASSSVSVINHTKLVGVVRVGSSPLYAGYSGESGWVYVPNLSSANISVINGTNLVGTIAVGGEPYYSTYDPADGDMYVTNEAADTVTVIQGLKILANLTAGSSPQLATFDQTNDTVEVSNEDSGNLTEISGLNVTGTIEVGTQPRGLLFDPIDGYLYVMNQQSDNLSVLFHRYPVTISQVGLPGGTPWSFTLSRSAPINTSAQSISIVEGNETYAYSAGTTNHSYTAPPGTFLVPGSPTTVTVRFHLVTFNATFESVGFPLGTPWSVTIGQSVTNTSSARLTFVGPNGTYHYRIGEVPGWTTSNFTGSFLLNGSSVQLTFLWTQITYIVVFDEYGLGSGGAWSVTLDGRVSPNTTFGDISFSEPNGTFPFTVSEIGRYTASPAEGTIQVNGSTTYFTVNFVAEPPEEFAVTFEEGGLPQGTDWGISIAGSAAAYTTSTALSVDEPNGTYEYAVLTPNDSVSASGGSFQVAGANSRPILVEFNPVVFAVTFEETGLPFGTNWSVSVGGETDTAPDTSLSVALPNGTYEFTIDPIPGYLATPGHGSITVSGAPASRTIAFGTTAHPTSDLRLFGEPWWAVIAVAGGVGGFLLLLLAVRRTRRSLPPPSSRRRPPGRPPPAGWESQDGWE